MDIVNKFFKPQDKGKIYEEQKMNVSKIKSSLVNPPQCGKVTGPIINPSPGGGVTGPSQNPSPGGLVSRTGLNPPQGGRVSGPRKIHHRVVMAQRIGRSTV